MQNEHSGAQAAIDWAAIPFGFRAADPISSHPFRSGNVLVTYGPITWRMTVYSHNGRPEFLMPAAMTCHQTTPQPFDAMTTQTPLFTFCDPAMLDTLKHGLLLWYFDQQQNDIEQQRQRIEQQRAQVHQLYNQGGAQ